MALSLTAEQKNLKNLFYNEDRYIIPEYQRPYTWNYDTCYQMYCDITEAYNLKIDYFLGNLIMARSSDDESMPQVVDGQQRLLTIWLWLKALSVLMPNFAKLQKATEVELWTRDADIVPKVQSNVFETDDNKSILAIWKHTQEITEECIQNSRNKKKEIDLRKCNSQLEFNYYNIYEWIKAFFGKISDIKKQEFIDYLVNQVYLLPIELKDKTIEAANTKALKIFETINNRGQNLENADIFKARLYNKAKSIKEEKKFIEDWILIREQCDNLSITVDDLFRYYAHIIRGKNNIFVAEKSLRDFFDLDPISPLNHNDYQYVVNDLMKIISILYFLSEESQNKSNAMPWLQILDQYTNQYPRFATVAYLYANDDRKDFVLFLKYLVRYCYGYGSSSSIKFNIYIMISNIMQHLNLESNIQLEKNVDFDTPGRLKKGFAMLAYFLSKNVPLSNTYTFSMLIKNNQKSQIKVDLQENKIDEIIGSLGNYMIFPKSEPTQHTYFSIYNSLRNVSCFTQQEINTILQRNNQIKKLLSTFFSQA